MRSAARGPSSISTSSRSTVRSQVIVFDNEGPLEDNSQVSEYQLDFDEMTAEQIWSYQSDPPVYTFVLGEPTTIDDGGIWSTGRRPAKSSASTTIEKWFGACRSMPARSSALAPSSTRSTKTIPRANASGPGRAFSLVHMLPDFRSSLVVSRLRAQSSPSAASSPALVVGSVLLGFAVCAVHAMKRRPTAFLPVSRARERGSRGLVARADDLSAVHLNPAGLARQSGTRIYLSNRFAYSDERFKRAPTLDWNDQINGSPAFVEFDEVRNEKPFQALDPMLGVSTDFGLRQPGFCLECPRTSRQCSAAVPAGRRSALHAGQP